MPDSPDLVPDLGAVYPLAWLDPRDRCVVCGGQAEYSDAWGVGLYCSPECLDKARDES